MHLVKLSISKDALTDRDACEHALAHVVPQDTLQAAMPAARGTTDAVRTAASYALLQWRKFQHNGNECRAIAASPKGETGRGLNLHIHVQVRNHSSVEYSTLVCRLVAQSTTSTPIPHADEGTKDFPELYAALRDIPALVTQGQTCLYDNDLRKLIDALMAPYAFDLGWKGVRLVLSDEGRAYAQTLERTLAPCLTAGALTISLIALDMSAANRETLARELAEEFTEQLTQLTERCLHTAPNTKAITAAYEALSVRLASAEELLGVEIPCLDALVECEQAIMALA